MMSEPTRNNYVQRAAINNNIQYLRGIAASLVVLDHSMLRLANANGDYAILRSFAGEIGAFGVYVFFVLSGYLMVVITDDGYGLNKAFRFLGARILRIAPLYFIATFLTILVGALITGRQFPLGDIVLSLLFIATNARPEDGALTPVLGVGWTLNYEMFFYVIFAFGLLFAIYIRWTPLKTSPFSANHDSIRLDASKNLPIFGKS